MDELNLNKMKQAFQPLLDRLRYLESLSLNDLDAEYRANQRVSEQLGKSGWVISGRLTPNNPVDWLNEIKSGGEETIARYFLETDINEMLANIVHHYISLPECIYLNQGIDNYFSGRYTEAAMFLLAVLDYRICCITPEEVRKKAKQCNEISTVVRNRVFIKTEGRIFARIFLSIDYIPSFVAYAKRLFLDGGYSFENKIEPPYLNRNWLMHGRMTRTVKSYECVQIINALNTLIEIEEEIADTNQKEVTPNGQAEI